MTRSDYAKILDKVLVSARRLRFQYTSRPECVKYGADKYQKAKLFDVGGEEFEEYQFYINEISKNTSSAIKEVFTRLLSDFNYDYDLIPDKKVEPCYWGFVSDLNNAKRTILLFKDYGFDKRIGELKLNQLMREYKADSYMYISYVRDFAYSEVINHTEDENDPARGTNTYSIIYLLETLFGKNEAKLFLEFADEIVQNLKECVGIKPIKSLSPYSLYGFRLIVADHLEHITLNTVTLFSKDQNKNVQLSNNDITSILTQYKNHGFYRSMISENDFSISFITAEWLYDALEQSSSIDLSSIIMGYCKSLEQLLFQIIKFHANEGRSIKPSKGNPSDRIELTTERINQYEIDSSWGSLVYFMSENKDIFRCSELSEDGIEYILTSLRIMNSKRNQYFHKKNCDNTEYTEKIKEYVYKTICCLLGAISFTEEQQRILYQDYKAPKSDFQKLAEYINLHANRLFYLVESETSNPRRVFSTADLDFKCTNSGMPIFSGVYFTIPFSGEIIKYTEELLPFRIYTGEMTLVPNGIACSPPQELLWDNGKFTLEYKDESYKY